MITTIDGYNKKAGDITYLIAWSNATSSYYPSRHKVDLMDESLYPEMKAENVRFFHDKELCAEQCRLMNQDKI